MRTLLLAIAAAVAFTISVGPAVARAQSTTVTTVFVAVDGIRYAPGGQYYVTGVVQGEPAAREVMLFRSTSGDAFLEFQRECERFLLLAMERRGQYVVTADRYGFGTNYTICSISRVNP